MTILGTHTKFARICFILLTAFTAISSVRLHATTFGEDVAFLKKYTDVIVLQGKQGDSKIALAPAWQGRVMSSSSAADDGRSYGWINRELIASGKVRPHINAFGGEDRFWMGPEGGQFSIFFAKGVKFELANWFTPAVLDTQPFELISRTSGNAVFGAAFKLTNYSGTDFHVAVRREVRVLEADEAWKNLGVSPSKEIRLVAYETNNQITNAGTNAWKKETGLLSIWILGMYNPSPRAIVIVPIKPGPESQLGVKVTSDYFGAIPPDRLAINDRAIYLKADGNYRSKIGISPARTTGVLGSYDPEGRVLTLVQFTKPDDAMDYVNSLWKLQDNPYAGDAANSYNDGSPAPGVKQLGPFYEIESSSPAAALVPGASLLHTHRTLHLHGSGPELDRIARAVLGISLNEIKGAFDEKKHPN